MIDEAHKVISRRFDDVREPVILRFARTLRKRGGGIIYGTQDFADPPSAVHSATNGKIVFRIQGGENVRAVAGSLALNPQQAQMLLELPPRCAVIKSSFLGCYSPMLMRVAELDVSARAAPGEIAARMAESVEGRKWTEENEARPETKSEPPKTASPALPSKRTLDYLQHIAGFPFLWASRRDEALKISAAMGTKLRQELEAASLIKLHHMKTGTRGGLFLLTEITKEGEELLRQFEVVVKPRKGKGGFVHRAAQHYVAAHYRKARPGAAVTIEDGSSGKSVDVAVVGDGLGLAVEILVEGVSKELRNIAADLLSYDEVEVVCDDKDKMEELREKVREAFSESERQRVRFAVLSKFLDGKG